MWAEYSTNSPGCAENFNLEELKRTKKRRDKGDTLFIIISGRRISFCFIYRWQGVHSWDE